MNASTSCSRFACALAVLIATTALGVPSTGWTQSSTRSRLASNTEPGVIHVEDILPRPVNMTVLAEAPIYYQSDMQRVLGAMPAQTPVRLVAMSDAGYKVRGRARHGDVAGWMRAQDLRAPDPKLPEKLKAFYERQKTVDAIIDNRQVALGMTSDEVKASLGNPSRKNARITAAGREESLEYSIFDRVPQIVTGRDQFGNIVQNTIYVKVEVGRLTVSFKDDIVSEIEETVGNPLGRGGVRTVPGPIILF